MREATGVPEIVSQAGDVGHLEAHVFVNVLVAFQALFHIFQILSEIPGNYCTTFARTVFRTRIQMLCGQAVSNHFCGFGVGLNTNMNFARRSDLGHKTSAQSGAPKLIVWVSGSFGDERREFTPGGRQTFHSLMFLKIYQIPGANNGVSHALLRTGLGRGGAVDGFWNLGWTWIGRTTDLSVRFFLSGRVSSQFEFVAETLAWNLKTLTWYMY